MPQAIAIFISLLFLSTVFIITACVLVSQLMPQHQRQSDLRWFIVWSAKGGVVPLAAWMVMNFGVSWGLQPFMPEVQAAQLNGGDWVSEYLRAVGLGLFIISSYWTPVTLAWSLARASHRLSGEPRNEFKALCWTCLFGLLLPALAVLWLGGWPTLGLAATIILAPMAGWAPGLLCRVKLPPMYARAMARMKFGKYTEAEWEIIRELEKCEDDFQGWMMLAELYAIHFHDIAEAEQTVLEICDQPKTTPSQLSVALQRLADWQLKACNPDAARRALQMICDRLKGTHLARMARLRFNQLPATAEELREQQTVHAIPLPALGDKLDTVPGGADSELNRDQAVALANGCVQKLKQDPNNVAAREKLARLFAERLAQAGLGIEQMMLLLNLPDQPEGKRAEWLGSIAAWQIKYQQDLDTGRKTLERVVEEFPHSPQALTARRRLRLLAEEGYRG